MLSSSSLFLWQASGVMQPPPLLFFRTINMFNKCFIAHFSQQLNMYNTYIMNRIRIPYNCVELIFGMVHPSTFERLKTQLFFFNSWSNVSTLGVTQSLRKTPRVETFDQELKKTNCVFKRSKVEGCTIPKIHNEVIQHER